LFCFQLFHFGFQKIHKFINKNFVRKISPSFITILGILKANGTFSIKDATFSIAALSAALVIVMLSVIMLSVAASQTL
jgi:hypothetical protein